MLLSLRKQTEGERIEMTREHKKIYLIDENLVGVYILVWDREKTSVLINGTFTVSF